jgi:UPF0755 protein
MGIMSATRAALIVTVVAGIFSAVSFLNGAPEKPDVFTVSVDPKRKEIHESTVAEAEGREAVLGRLRRGLAKNIRVLSTLANPSVKYVRIYPGMRKEEIAEAFARKLEWSDEEKNTFIETANDDASEGYFYPDTYFVLENAGPEIQEELTGRFDEEVRSRYPTSTRSIIDVDTAIKIASIIQREAAGKSDMRLISGVIWNRVFEGMKLEMDATLQYVKGNKDIGWWPRVKAEDKYLESPYNTYRTAGFPPTPIANPSMEAIEAALNPAKTDCIFYIHDRLRRIHCAKTYEEHVRNIKKYL